MPKKLLVFFHPVTGNVKTVTKKQAKLLPPEYKQVWFITNDKGEKVMRFNFDGATVDVQENEVPEVKIVTEGE